MTNADIDVKQEFHQNNPTVWEMFTETAVKSDKELTDILPGETVEPASSKTILPGVPTPTKNDAPEGPSNKKEVEPPIELEDYERPEVPKGEAAVTRTMDPEVQKPKMKSEQKKPQEPPRKITKVSQPIPMPQLAPSPNTQQIMGPIAPELDPNQPRPTDSGNGSKHGSGVYPSIYGPESLEPPGGGGGDSSDPPPFDFIPAAEFPAGPLHPSPYLNDFSRMLKT